MISLILPYWDRQQAADEALRLLAATYKDVDLEVVVVDDGNLIPFVAPDVRLNIKTVTLPTKHEPKSPVTAWNAGVREASGEIIVLSCIEILHKQPVLEQMASAVRNIGPLGYVLAAAWCPETDSWHCHSTVKTPRNPWGTGIAFCGAMYKDLYLKAGGFDEAYREGAGYEDNDFINRMLVAGARFLIRDDLVVTHPKTGATIEWGLDKFAKNDALYYSKWPTELKLNSITFCCVNAGNYLGRGQEYVEKLYGMLINCLPDGLAFKFVCFTDEPFKHEAIKCRPLPVEGLTGWNNKIALFREGVFEPDERVVYFDLDTLLIGRIDRLVDYQGEFATLRDFWRPEGLGPAVMLWRGGFGSFIWDEFEKAGRPELERGDQEWLEKVLTAPAILQDMYPGIFCSYKSDCNPHPPADTSVVCFHGLPRPHEVTGWAKQAWDGTVTGSALELLCNTERTQIIANIKANADQPLLEPVEAHAGEIALCGGGPSIVDHIEHIRALQARGGKVIGMNGTSKFLSDHGIVPDFHISIDARESNKRFIGYAKKYVIASQCHPSLFDCDAAMFHVANVDWDKYAERGMALGGGHSVGLYAMSLAYVLGYRTMNLYGYDSSYRESHHAYEQKSNDTDPIIDAYVNDRSFKTTAWMVAQVNEFKVLAHQLSLMGCHIVTHGDGLLPYVAFQMAALAKAA